MSLGSTSVSGVGFGVLAETNFSAVTRVHRWVQMRILLGYARLVYGFGDYLLNRRGIRCRLSASISPNESISGVYYRASRPTSLGPDIFMLDIGGQFSLHCKH